MNCVCGRSIVEFHKSNSRATLRIKLIILIGGGGNLQWDKNVTQNTNHRIYLVSIEDLICDCTLNVCTRVVRFVFSIGIFIERAISMERDSSRDDGHIRTSIV